jgi:hypothetical protein
MAHAILDVLVYCIDIFVRGGLCARIESGPPSAWCELYCACGLGACVRAVLRDTGREKHFVGGRDALLYESQVLSLILILKSRD